MIGSTSRVASACLALAIAGGLVLGTILAEPHGGWLLASGTARAAFPGRPGLIAYDTTRQSGGAQSEETCGSKYDSIVTMRGDGSGRRRLGRGIDPAYSPDGRLIAFSVCDGVQSDLMIMRSDGTHIRRVTETARVSESEPAFSADGRRLLFARDSGGEGYADIYSIGIDGSALRRLAVHHREASDQHPEEAADGRFVVFDRDGEVFTMRPNGSRVKRLVRGWDPAVSPESRRVVYTFRGQLHLIGAGGGGGRQLTHLRNTRNARAAALSATFSPNGRWVVFALERSVDYGPGFADSQRLMEVSTATGRTTALTKTSVGGFNPDWQPLSR